MGKRIKRRKDGRYEAKYTVQTATGIKRKSVYGDSQKEVREKLARALADSQDGLFFDAGNLTVTEYLNRWLTDSVRDSVKRRTHESYVCIVNRHIVPAIGRCKLKALNPAQVQSLYRSKLDQGLSPTTVEHIHTTLHRALKQAVRWQLIPRNVCGAVTPPKRVRSDFEPLSGEQAKALLRAAKGERYEALYVLALTTGMRQGELLGLRWGDVDLDRGVLRIRRALVTGYGKQTYEVPKTAKGRRSVALTPTAVAALRRHGNGYEDDGPVFRNRVGGPVHPKNLVDRSFRPLLKRARLPQIRLHDLRYTAATLLLGKGVHPKIVQEMLGHANISITLDTYSHVLPNMQAPAVDAMQDTLEDDS